MSAICFDLDQSKILLSGNELNVAHLIEFVSEKVVKKTELKVVENIVENGNCLFVCLCVWDKTSEWHIYRPVTSLDLLSPITVENILISGYKFWKQQNLRFAKPFVKIKTKWFSGSDISFSDLQFSIVRL